MTEQKSRATMQDCRELGFSPYGVKQFILKLGFDWSGFIRDGISCDALRATGDGHAIRLANHVEGVVPERQKVWTHHVRIHQPYTTTVADMLQNMLAANVYQEDYPAPTVTLDDAGMLIVYHDTNPEAFIP